MFLNNTFGWRLDRTLCVRYNNIWYNNLYVGRERSPRVGTMQRDDRVIKYVYN